MPEQPLVTSPAPRPTVLVVDDYPDTSELYAEAFSMSGFNVVVLRDPDEIVQRVASFEPALIVVDVKSSLESAKLLRRLNETDSRHAPLIFVGADVHAAPEELELPPARAVRLPKPCLPDLLVQQARSLLGLEPMEDPSSRARSYEPEVVLWRFGAMVCRYRPNSRLGAPATLEVHRDTQIVWRESAASGLEAVDRSVRLRTMAERGLF